MGLPPDQRRGRRLRARARLAVASREASSTTITSNPPATSCSARPARVASSVSSASRAGTMTVIAGRPPAYGAAPAVGARAS